jgi:hypothetical protein
MKSGNIALYGHLSYDNIFSKFNLTTSVGCMGNVWLSIKNKAPEINVKVQPLAIGESLILVDKEQSKRTSVSSLNLYTQPCKPQAADIHHVMYINELNDISFLKDLEGFITADVCNGAPLDITSQYLQYIDLLFLSDEDINFDIKDILLHVPQVLLHRPGGSKLYTQDKTYEFTTQIINGVNVLGLGDKFAAYTLVNLIKNNFNVYKSIQPSHDDILNELQKI